VTNAAYNGTIATGGTTAFGFNASWKGTNPDPAGFALNGTTCTGTVDGSAPPSSGGSGGPSRSTSPSSPAGPSSAGPSSAGPSSAGPSGSRPPCTATGGGDGPYPAGYETSTGRSNHTIYRPECLPATPMPIFVWGNGGCSADGTSSLPFLREIASYGFLVIASGSPGGSGSTTSALMTQSMNWAIAENSRPGSKYYGRLDTTRIAVAGWSCGGLESLRSWAISTSATAEPTPRPTAASSAGRRCCISRGG
jgi:hypothetical protein